jgi:hypothetical protein
MRLVHFFIQASCRVAQRQYRTEYNVYFNPWILMKKDRQPDRLQCFVELLAFDPIDKFSLKFLNYVIILISFQLPVLINLNSDFFYIITNK